MIPFLTLLSISGAAFALPISLFRQRALAGGSAAVGRQQATVPAAMQGDS